MSTLKTPNGVTYSVVHLKNVDIAKLYPESGRDTREKIRQARRWLYSHYPRLLSGGVDIERVARQRNILTLNG